MESGDHHHYYFYTNCSNLTKPWHDDDIVYSIPASDAVVAAEVLTTIVAVLSIIGCILIIFSYIAYKDLRTKARAMLLQLSIADLIISLSRIVGLYMNYKRYTQKRDHMATYIYNSTSDPRCYTQAAFTTYGSVASLLWSNVIGIYMVMLVLMHKKSEKKNLGIYLVSCFICWVLPLIVVIGDGVARVFGFVVITLTGCYILSTPFGNVTKYHLAELFSYDIWVYLTLILLPVLYAILFYYTQCKFKVLLSWKGSPDMKLLLVPIIFVLTRMCSVILRSAVYYVNTDKNIINTCSLWVKVMVVVDGVGINAQGLVNAVLFCFFTRAVRIRMWRTCKQVHHKMCVFHKEREPDEEKAPTEWNFLNNEMTTSSYESLN